MKKISFYFFLFTSLLSYAQKKESITIKKQDEIFFYRVGEFKDSVITKNTSDVFYIDMSDNLKTSTEIRLINATFVRTNDDTRFKLIRTQGMRYRMIYLKESPEDLNSNEKLISPQISPDGASTSPSKDIIIELWDTKTNKLILKNIFSYTEK